MILNGVKTTVTLSAAASIAPLVAGSLIGGIAAGTLVASSRVHGFIRDAILKRRVGNLEQHARLLGIDPSIVAVDCRTNQSGDKFGKNHPRLLSDLIQDKGQVQFFNDMGLSNDHYRISRKAVVDAKKTISAMVVDNWLLAKQKSEVTVMASISDYGISMKSERGCEAANDGMPGSLRAAKTTLDRFMDRIGVSMSGNSREVARRIGNTHHKQGIPAVQHQRGAASDSAFEM